MTRFLLPTLAVGCLLSLAAPNHVAAQSPGTRDPSFVESGFFLTKIVALPDGRYLGLGKDDGSDDSRVHRFLADGSVDGSFVAPEAEAKDFLLLPDDKILISGAFTEVGGQPHRFVARLNADGRLDASFNPDLSGLSVGVNQMLRQKSGKIVVDSAHIASTGLSYSLLSRLNTDGSLDKSFETSVDASFLGTLRLQSDDKIIVAGAVNKLVDFTRYDYYRLGRLNADGTTDNSFRAAAETRDGHVFFPADVLILPDDRIVTGGSIDGDDDLDTGYVLRYSADGVLDTDFKVTVTGPASPENNTNVNVSGLARQKDGKILLCGEFTAVNGVPNQAVARLNTDGTTDTAFSALGTFNAPQGAGSPDEVALQKDGKVLLSGFLFYKGGPNEGIIRLLNDDGTTEPPPVNAKLPDLEVGFGDIKSGFNAKGTKVKFKGNLIVRNAGKKSAKGVIVGAYVSDDKSFSADDKPLSTVAVADFGKEPLKKKTDAVLAVTFKGKSAGVGPLTGKYLLVVVDPRNTVEELDDTDNVSATGPLP